MNADKDVQYDFGIPDFERGYTWDEQGFLRRKTASELIEEHERILSISNAREREEAKRRHEERVAEKGRLVCAVEDVVKGADEFGRVISSIFFPFVLIYLPVRLLFVGLGKLAHWLWREASDEATRAVKAARTKARDFEKATRPE